MAQLNTNEAIREKLGHSYIQLPFENLALADTLEVAVINRATGREAGELFEAASYVQLTEQNARLVQQLTLNTAA